MDLIDWACYGCTRAVGYTQPLASYYWVLAASRLCDSTSAAQLLAECDVTIASRDRLPPGTCAQSGL